MSTAQLFRDVHAGKLTSDEAYDQLLSQRSKGFARPTWMPGFIWVAIVVALAVLLNPTNNRTNQV